MDRGDNDFNSTPFAAPALPADPRAHNTQGVSAGCVQASIGEAPTGSRGHRMAKKQVQPAVTTVQVLPPAKTACRDTGRNSKNSPYTLQGAVVTVPRHSACLAK